MNSTLLKYNVKPADRLVVPKSNIRFIQHHAIYLGQNEFGTDLIAENKFGQGVRLITAEEFFRGVNSITRIERFNGNNYERKMAVQRALREMGKPYNLINYNCESFANHVQHGRASSSQAGWGLLGLFALLVGVLAISRE